MIATEGLHHRRTSCRLCESDQLELVLKLEPTPPANAFVPESLKGIEQPRFPLDVFFCNSCTHLQLLDVVDAKMLFENYVYVSGTSPVFIQHFKNYSQDIINRYHPQPNSLVVDIGSNDGTLLSFFKDSGFSVLGVDPARDIAAEATTRGIKTICGFFTQKLAEEIILAYGQASIITANNVFAHADDLSEITQGVKALLAPDGVFSFEVSYLADVVEKTLFDTIYHEHVAFHSVRPLVTFLKHHGLELIEAVRVDSHGGSLRAIAQKSGGPHPHGSSVDELISLEDSMGLNKIETFKSFSENIELLKKELSELLKNLKAQGAKIAGFGAPAKATTLMYHFGIGPEVIDYVIDDSPLKQNLYTPGMHIPVVNGQAIQEKKPDYLLILAWNFADSIIKRNQAYLDSGGHFIVPLPKVSII
jgi:SAM-dependent methyltransferase